MWFIAIIASVIGSICTENVADLKFLQPEQVHIAFGEKQNDIVVTWSTLKETKETLLQFGEGIPTTQVTGQSKVFIDGGKLKLKQWIHRVQLKDLKFKTTYYYKVGSKYGWSKIFSFTTSESEEHLAVNAMIIGDLGQENITSYPYMLADAKHKHYDVLLHVGDFAYDMDSQNGERGNDFMNTMEPLTATIPYMIVPGNHEFAYNYSHIKERFSMPGYETFESMYHSFDLGLLHFIGINTEAYYDNSDWPAHNTSEPGQFFAHYNWLKQNLDEANRPENRQKHPWIVVFGHRPFYCTDSTPGDECLNHTYPHRAGLDKFGGLGLEKLLTESGVDLIIWAHEHSYERFWPVYDKKMPDGYNEEPYVNPIYPIQVTSGAAGCREGTDKFVPDPDPWSAFRSSHFGYSRLYCPNRTHLYFEELNLASVCRDCVPTAEDSFWLVKDDHKTYKL